MEDSITIKPAKRILVLYTIAFLIVLTILGFGLDHLRLQEGLAPLVASIAWKSAILIGLGALAYSFLWRLTSIFGISDKCVTATVGILSKQHIRIQLNRIVDYRVITPLLERILGLGSIYIDTAGDDDLEMREISQEEIDLVVQKLDKLLNKEQRRADNVSNVGI